MIEDNDFSTTRYFVECVIFSKALKPTLLTLITFRHIHFRLVGECVGAGQVYGPRSFIERKSGGVRCSFAADSQVFERRQQKNHLIFLR